MDYGHSAVPSRKGKIVCHIPDCRCGADMHVGVTPELVRLRERLQVARAALTDIAGGGMSSGRYLADLASQALMEVDK